MRQGDTPYLISPNAMLLHDPDEKRSLGASRDDAYVVGRVFFSVFSGRPHCG